ncbi:zinc finger protein 629-like isoform X1 [Culex pipiens pallens]|uniref:zinc finger protein 629-like isoform X1 n=1 Tax=Culex pipiens pallens TaxID=42434 RepID=UPI001954D87E|nr:zinc finger protein 629-like isoform X1 [Culex pipiens pallens]
MSHPNRYMQRQYMARHRQRKREARLQELEVLQREREALQPELEPEPFLQQFEEPPPNPQPKKVPKNSTERVRAFRARKKLLQGGVELAVKKGKVRMTSTERVHKFRMLKKLKLSQSEPEVQVQFVPNEREAGAGDPLEAIKEEPMLGECSANVVSECLNSDPLLVPLKYDPCVESDACRADPMDPGASTSAIQTIKQEPDPELSTPALDGFFGPAALWESLQNVPDPVTEPDQEGAPRGRKNPTVTLDSIKKELTYECELCGKRFRKSADFFQHKLTHGEELKCADCDERFFRTWDLEKHRVEKHSDSEIYKCDTCSKTFIEHWRLLRHQRTHSTEKKFKCDMCDKSFTESGNLAKHKKQVHTKDRPFSCEICSKSYPQKKDLQGHMLVHTMKRFACTVCQEEFSLLDEKRAHMRELHPNETVEKTFTCTVCEATFNSKLKHSSHVLTHGERRFECQFCMKKFHTNARVRKHMKSHRVELYSKCHICDKCFSQDCNLKRHIEQMHMQGDRYSCLHCTALFDSADELRGHRESEHQNEHPYKCPCCPKAFAFHQSLVNHAKCHNNPKRHLQEFIKPSPRKRKQQQPKEASDGTEVAVKKRGRPKKKIVVMPEPEFVDLMETVMLRETVPIKVECDAGEHAEPAQLDSSELVSEIKVESTIFEETETTDKTCLI